jgi:hypothetical protein
MYGGKSMPASIPEGLGHSSMFGYAKAARTSNRLP